MDVFGIWWWHTIGPGTPPVTTRVVEKIPTRVVSDKRKLTLKNGCEKLILKNVVVGEKIDEFVDEK